MTLLPLPALLTVAALLAAATPAAATGPWQPPAQPQTVCPTRPDPARHSRASDVPMRGERNPDAGCIRARRPGPLHHIFHGHRR